MNIRAATVQDLLHIKQIDSTLFQEDSYPLFVLRQFLDISNGLLQVAETAGTVAGYTLGHYNPEKAEGWILSLAVLPDYRGQQAGYKLTASVLAEMEAKGAVHTYLTVYPDNLSALALYRRLGFSDYAASGNYYQDHSPRTIMRRTAVR